MFDKLIARLKQGNTVTIDQLARELGTSPEVVNGMIEHMTRQGWLRSMSASCDSTCGACIFARDCIRATTSRVWQPVTLDPTPAWQVSSSAD